MSRTASSAASASIGTATSFRPRIAILRDHGQQPSGPRPAGALQGRRRRSGQDDSRLAGGMRGRRRGRADLPPFTGHRGSQPRARRVCAKGRIGRPRASGVTMNRHRLTRPPRSASRSRRWRRRQPARSRRRTRTPLGLQGRGRTSACPTAAITRPGAARTTARTSSSSRPSRSRSRHRGRPRLGRRRDRRREPARAQPDRARRGHARRAPQARRAHRRTSRQRLTDSPACRRSERRQVTANAIECP